MELITAQRSLFGSPSSVARYSVVERHKSGELRGQASTGHPAMIDPTVDVYRTFCVDCGGDALLVHSVGGVQKTIHFPFQGG